LIGGGIFASTASINASTIVSNTASAGGGLRADGAVIVNATLAFNTADSGSAVQFAGSLAAINATVFGNSAKAIGGVAATELYTLTDSIVGGASPVCTHARLLTGKNVIQDTSCGTGSSVIVADPLLGPLQANGGPTLTMAPISGSPAVGVAGNCLPTDQRGVARSAPCDAGAVETDFTPTTRFVFVPAVPVNRQQN
jgi:hypothetical protein